MTSEINTPRESSLLKEAQRKSGLTVAELSTATGMSTGTIHIALNGLRYRDGEPRLAVPSDSTLVKLASVLRIRPVVLQQHGRERAAELLAEAGDNTVTFASDQHAQAVAAGRAALARQILSAFSDEDLREELDRRERADHDEHEAEARAEIIADLKNDLGVP